MFDNIFSLLVVVEITKFFGSSASPVLAFSTSTQDNSKRFKSTAKTKGCCSR